MSRGSMGWTLGAMLGLTACLRVPPAGSPVVEATTPAAPRRVHVALAPGEIYRVGEVRQFEIQQAGQTIGTSWGRYLGRTAAGHRFETRIELRVVGRPPARSAGELLLDDRGALRSGFERSEAAELSFARKGDLLVTSDGTRTDEVTYDPERRDTAFMAHSAIMHAELMLALRELHTGELAWRLVSLSGGVPVEWSAHVLEATDDGSQIRLETSLGEIITLSHGRIAKLEVAASQLTIVAAAEPVWPSFEVHPPRNLSWSLPEGAGFTVRELELPAASDEPKLAGELLVPVGTTARVPAVLFLSATGQEDRHGFAGPPPVDLGTHELTDALAEAGLVVLRFDERGRGRSEAGPLGFLAQFGDARRALATLAVQPEVDPDRLVVVGHGEGGLRALMLANERAADVHAIALMATPGRPYEQVLRAQAQARLDELPPELRESARAHQKAMIDDLAAGRVPPELAPQAEWLREIFAVRPAELIARIRVPILLAQGEKDFEVDPIADADALVRASKRARGKLELRRYPGLDHLFKPEPEVSRPERYLIDRRVDTRFIADVVAWTQRVTAR